MRPPLSPAPSRCSSGSCTGCSARPPAPPSLVLSEGCEQYEVLYPEGDTPTSPTDTTGAAPGNKHGRLLHHLHHHQQDLVIS